MDRNRRGFGRWTVTRQVGQFALAGLLSGEGFFGGSARGATGGESASARAFANPLAAKPPPAGSKR